MAIIIGGELQYEAIMEVQRMFKTVMFVLASVACWAVHAQARFDFNQTPTVLPKTVVPRHYALTLDLNPAQANFDGRVVITLRISQPTDRIVLHADQLTLRKAWLAPALAGSQARQFTALTQAKASDPPKTWTLKTADGRPIATGVYDMEISYSGPIQKAGEGLYRADHRVAGQAATMLATQLQAVNGRTLVPSFDEPVFRASFDLTVRAPNGWQVLGNMPVQNVRSVGTQQEHRFETTPPMPSYLLALAVGRFDVLSSQAAGVPLRIVTAPGLRDQGEFAMRMTEKLLPYYNQYFGVPYSLPKLDQLAVPGTRTGAMEDWGLISYVEPALLFDPKRSSPSRQRGVFSIVAHEIAHQWFGNLVSVASWEEIWLNEAFATWMEAKAADHFFPEWQTVSSGRGWIERTMERDATDATRAIRSGAVPEERVFDVFDGITYSKGGAVLSMIEQWVGEVNFQKGLAAYMAERRMKSATAGDLWHHVGAAVNQPVAAMAASWTDQPGFPLITLDARCSNGKTELQWTQQRFRLLPSTTTDSPLWRVPLRVARGAELHTFLLEGAKGILTLPGCTGEPLVGNAGGRGFYRVRYESEQAAALSKGWNSLAAVDRSVLLADSYALAQAGVQPLAAHWRLLAKLPQVPADGRATLYATAVNQIQALDVALHGTPAQAPLRQAARRLLGDELARIGWQPADAKEDAEITRLRPMLISGLAALGDEAVIAQAKQRFADALNIQAGGTVHPSVRAAVLAATGRAPSPEQTEGLWKALRAAEQQEEIYTLLVALAATPDAAQARRFLSVSLESWLAPNVAVELPSMLADHPRHAEMAYQFTREQWQRLAARAGSGVFGARQELLPDAVGGMTDLAAAERMRADQARLAGPTGRVGAERAAARLAVRAALRQREAQNVTGWALAS
jgi:aminopeptidase N